MSSTPPSTPSRTSRFARFAARASACTAIVASSLGGLAALASHPASAAPATPGLTTLTLKNSWHSENSDYSSGNPAVTRESNGLVHLSGSMAGGTTALAFVLPAADRPTVNLYLTTYTSGSTTGYLEIAKTGQVYAYGTYAADYTGLAGISFQSVGSTLSFSTEKLVNGWTSEQTAYGTGNPIVAVDGHGTAHLSGSLAGGVSETTAFVLPVGARPLHNVYVNTYSYGGSVGSLLIQPDGEVIPFGSSVDAYTSLTGVTFRTTTSGNKALMLQNSWLPDTSYNSGKPAMFKDASNVVHLLGGLNISSDEQPALTLPLAARPAHNLWMPVYTYDGAQGTIVIYTDGTVYLYGQGTGTTNVSTADEYTSLSGITFQAGV